MVFFDFLSIDFQKKLYICNRETPKEKTLIYTAKKLFHTLMAPPRVKAAYWQHVLMMMLMLMCVTKGSA